MGQFLWEREIAAPPAKARAWWFDFQENDHLGHHHTPLYKRKPATRKILSRTPDTVVLEDDFGQGPPMKATVKLVGADSLSTAYESRLYRSNGTVSFKPKGSGSVARLEFTNEWRGIAKIFGPLFQKSFENLVRKDLDAHAMDLDEAWKSQPW